MKKVLFVPDLKYNLLSVSQASQSGKCIQFDKDGAQIKDVTTKETVGTATRKGMLYHVNTITTGEKFSPRSKREMSNNKDMEKAFLCMKENNFKEEIMKRLDRIEEDKLTLSERINSVEEDMNYSSPSYSLIKEDRFQNEQASQKSIYKAHQLNEMTCSQEDFFSFSREDFDSEDEEELSIQEDKLEVENENKEVGNSDSEDNEVNESGIIYHPVLSQIFTSQEDFRFHSDAEVGEGLEELESTSVIHADEIEGQSCSFAVHPSDVKDQPIRESRSTRKILKKKLLSVRRRCSRFFCM